MSKKLIINLPFLGGWWGIQKNRIKNILLYISNKIIKVTRYLERKQKNTENKKHNFLMKLQNKAKQKYIGTIFPCTILSNHCSFPTLNDIPFMWQQRFWAS